MSKISFVALGGMDEKSKKCFVLEIDSNLYVFNTGVDEKLNESLGINKVIPDYTFLIENKNKIKGLFFGMPTPSNIGSLTTLLEKIGFDIPIITSEVGKSIIINNLTKCNRNRNYNEILTFITPTPMRDFMVDQQPVVSFKICNSMPGSIGFVLKTNDGNIVYLDDYIICQDQSKTFFSQIHSVHSIIKDQPVLLLITQTGIVGRSNTFTTPFHTNKDFYEKIISSTSGRVVVGIYNNDAYSAFSIAQVAKKYQRPFIIYSKEFVNTFHSTIKAGLYNNNHLLSLPLSELPNSKNPIIILCEEPKKLISRLSRIINQEDELLSFNENDTFVLGTQIIPGFEGNISRLLDEISKNDIKHITLPKTILPLESSNEDHKFLVSLIQPKYVIPVGGLYMSMVEYINVINQTWLNKDQVLLLDNGQFADFDNSELVSTKERMEMDLVPLNSTGGNDLLSSIIYERQQMLISGAVSINILVNTNHLVISDIIVNHDGLIDKNNTKLLQEFHEIKTKFCDEIYSYLVYNKKILDFKESMTSVKRNFSRICTKVFDKRPLVLASIIEAKN